MSITKVTFTRRKNGLIRKDGLWHGVRIDVRVAGKRYRSVFPTKTEAQRFIDELRTAKRYQRAGIKLPSKNSVTLRDLVAARLASLTTRKQKEFQGRVLKYFMNLAGEFTAVESITKADLRNFVDERSKELTIRNTPVTPQTVDRELVAIASMLHSAGDYFDELENYVAPKIPHPKYRKGRRERVITDDEATRLLAALNSISPMVARIFEFASLTGLRHSEIMRLRPTDLDRKARSLKVYRSKTDTTSEISPLTDRMLEILKSEGPFIFTPDGKTPPMFYKIMRKACAVCKIPYGRFEVGGVTLHDLRHSFITKLQQAGVDIATIQSFSGHSDARLVMRYSHARPESRRRAMAVMDGNGSDKLKAIYDKVRAGKMNFKAFLEAMK